MKKEQYQVRRIKYSECKPWLLKKHYAKRTPSVSYAFGLYKDNVLKGVCTYGTPSSAPLREGLCGKEYALMVLELNRLCLEDNKKNEASFLIGNSLKLLPASIVVSFADIGESHIGYVYQATNFCYCGLSAKRTNWAIKGKENLHGQTIGDEFRGQENRSELMREKYGEDFYLSPRTRKHRYVFFTGTKRQKKLLRKELKYPVLPYPKGESKHYDSGGTIPTQQLLF